MQSLYGIIPPMTTPFDDNEDVNLGMLQAEAKHLVENAKIHGIAVGGSTGEGHTLTTEELRQTVGTVCDATDGKVPIIAGIIVDSTRQAIERAKAVADLNVAALQITPVHYVFSPNDDATTKHFADVADAVDIPIIIYNVIWWNYCSPELLTHIIDTVPGVVGVKQSAGDLKLLADLIVLLGDRGRILSAVDALMYPSFSMGAHGAVAAILAAVPEMCVELWDAVASGDDATAKDLHVKLLAIWNAIWDDNLPANVKIALNLQGRPAGIPRSPMPQSSAAQKAAIKAALMDAGVSLV
ncbi:MAG: dihydrodipicolinate synthase family protein [Candidatus Latescibacteria bacterium]|jgi:4-hydroxy-tetrahydrodipicolinate synthase|nr:dihydrodipicolinate synthase family protein [Candidatus Latescibacterota bacterium]